MGIGTGVDNLSLDRESRPTKTGSVDEMLAEVETLFQQEGRGDAQAVEVHDGIASVEPRSSPVDERAAPLADAGAADRFNPYSRERRRRPIKSLADSRKATVARAYKAAKTVAISGGASEEEAVMAARRAHRIAAQAFDERRRQRE